MSRNCKHACTSMGSSLIVAAAVGMALARCTRLQPMLEVSRAILGRPGCIHTSSLSVVCVGIASQEIIKLITQQYVPFNNTLIFNGMTSQTTTFVL